MQQPVSAEIEEELRPILAAGFSVSGSEYSAAFGNFYVDLLRGTEKLRIIRDRNPYMVQGNESKLKAAGLSMAFDSKDDFFAALSRYAIGAGP